jgi:hypothetical protein
VSRILVLMMSGLRRYVGLDDIQHGMLGRFSCSDMCSVLLLLTKLKAGRRCEFAMCFRASQVQRSLCFIPVCGFVMVWTQR